MSKKEKKIKPPPSKRKNIIVISVCAFVIAVLIVGIVLANYYLNHYSLILHRFFAGDTIGANENNPVFAEADATVRDAAAESMVLLENKDDYLPRKNLKKVNLFGWASTEYGFLLTGGGSGGTSITNEKKYKMDPNDAFKAEGISYNTDLYKAYTSFSKFDADYRSNGSTGANVVESLKNPGESFYTEKRMTKAKEYSDVAVAFLSRWGAENVNNGGADELKNVGKYKDGTFLELTDAEKVMFDKLQEYGFNVIVVLNVCNNMELGFIDDYSCIKACIHAGIPGQTGAIAIPQIITGKVNPSGKTTDTLPYDYQTYNPTYLNTAKSGSHIAYQEGIYFGYKWYETADAEGFFDSVNNKYGTGYDAVVQYPFGYGLSYTTFSWDTQFPTETAITKDGKYTVNVTVTNTGTVAGKDVVQLYGHTEYKDGGIEKPERTLLDFAKTGLLAPGESETVSLSFESYDLASYDFNNKNSNGFSGYELEPGKVTISVQSNAHAVGDNADDKCASTEMNVATSIQYGTDPVTGESVVNRFTGNTAYANVPIDGSTVYTGDVAFEYLSRNSKFSNYAKLKRVQTPSNTGAVTTASKYRHDAYKTKDTKSYKYGKGMGLLLVQSQDKDGNKSRLSYDQLAGDAKAKNLVFYDSLMEALADYDNDKIWEPFLNQLKQNEIKELIGKGGFMTSAVYSVGKPRATDKDGPAGYNDNVTNIGEYSTFTLYPSESLLGCSWSKTVSYKIGEAQGKIGAEFGINGWYGPGVNLHRSVYNARNYEYFSEDGVLSGLLAANVIKGAKDNHVYCYLKHMAVSEEGINPKDVNTWLTEQTLREIYLRPFEIAVKKGKANAMMSAFNRVGAVCCGYNRAMLTDILRVEWGFRGSVITDWFMDDGGYMSNFELGVLAGNDLWLSGTTGKAARIDLSDNSIKYAARQSVKGILYTYISTNVGNTNIKINAEAHSALVVFLWTIVNVVLGIGILVCLFFIIVSIPPIRRRLPFMDRRYKKAVAAGEIDPDSPAVNESRADGENVDGENAENEHTESEHADGEHTDGEHTDDEHTDGEKAESETAQEQSDTVICDKCGTQNEADSLFCGSCGNKLK